MAETAEDTGPIGIYVHWPFCQAKCPYCDFNSHVVARVDQAEWRSAYAAEIDRYATERPNAIVGSIYFGGGTPSLMAPETVATVLDALHRRFRWTNDVEVTLEANPTSVEAARFTGYRAAGVNRVSMGIQALNDRDLRRLGRLHTAAEARAAFQIARGAFERVSFDLIYARQDQSMSDWQCELDDALDMAADHLSLYQLTIEPGTAFGDRFASGGLSGLPDDGLSADLFEWTQSRTAEAGLPAYEVSNHARPGSESRHNLLYWRGDDYIGIGPGAHGRLTDGRTRIATEAVAGPLDWMSGVRRGSGHETRETLTALDVAEERAMMGLRITEGVPLEALGPIRDLSNKICYLRNTGLVHAAADRLMTTAAGRPLLNALLRHLLA